MAICFATIIAYCWIVNIASMHSMCNAGYLVNMIHAIYMRELSMYNYMLHQSEYLERNAGFPLIVKVIFIRESSAMVNFQTVVCRRATIVFKLSIISIHYNFFPANKYFFALKSPQQLFVAGIHAIMSRC